MTTYPGETRDLQFVARTHPDDLCRAFADPLSCWLKDGHEGHHWDAIEEVAWSE